MGVVGGGAPALGTACMVGLVVGPGLDGPATGDGVPLVAGVPFVVVLDEAERESGS